MKILFLLTLLLPSSLFANTSQNLWRINKDHSQVFFKVPYLTISEVAGRFTKFTGKVYFNDDLNTIKSIHLEIKVNSIYTANKIRDKHLQSKDFFKSQEFPFITFHSEKIIMTGEAQYQVSGELTIRDVKRKMDVHFSLSEGVKDTWGYKNKFAKFKMKIDRRDFNIRWNKKIQDSEHLVGNIIDLWGSFQLQPLRFSTPASKHTLPDTKYIRQRGKLKRGEITQKQFDKEITSTPGILNYKSKKTNMPTIEFKPKNMIKDKSQPHSVSQDRNMMWWLSYSFTGVIGFMAMLIITIQRKKIFSLIFPEVQQKGDKPSLLPDIFIFTAYFLFCCSLWYIGNHQ